MTARTRAVGSPDATRAVDCGRRIDFARLRQERLSRATAALHHDCAPGIAATVASSAVVEPAGVQR